MAIGLVQRGHAIGALVIGILEIVISLIVIISSFVLSNKAQLATSQTPYWAGIPYIIPGILGIAVGVTKNRCCMIAFMVLNIICCILESIGTILVVIVLAFWAAMASTVKEHLATNCNTIGNNCVCIVNNKQEIVKNVTSCDVVSTIIGIMYLLVALLIISIIIALAGSIIGCISVCCSANSQTGTVIIQQPVQGGYMMQPGQVACQPQMGADGQYPPPGYAQKQ